MKRTPGRGALVRVLAWRRLTARPLRSCVTAAGVAIGVAFLFSILSLNAQLTSTAHDTAALLHGPRLLQVVPASPGGLPEQLAAQLARDPRVAATAPLMVTRAKMSNGPRETGSVSQSHEKAAVISRFFIDRPIFATVLSVVITLTGGVALAYLPVAQYPRISPPGRSRLRAA